MCQLQLKFHEIISLCNIGIQVESSISHENFILTQKNIIHIFQPINVGM